MTDELALELFPDNEILTAGCAWRAAAFAFPGLAGAHLLAGLWRARTDGRGHERAGRERRALTRRSRLDAIISTPDRSPARIARQKRCSTARDAVADWPILNALLNTACGATWVSFHHGGGVGMGYSLHAGQVTVADGTEMAARKIARVLNNDPGMGVARHADAGYELAQETAQENRHQHTHGRE